MQSSCSSLVTHISTKSIVPNTFLTGNRQRSKHCIIHYKIKGCTLCTPARTNLLRPVVSSVSSFGFTKQSTRLFCKKKNRRMIALRSIHRFLHLTLTVIFSCGRLLIITLHHLDNRFSLFFHSFYKVIKVVCHTINKKCFFLSCINIHIQTTAFHFTT